MASAFHELISQYEQYLRVEKNLSEKTRRAYLYDLDRFREFLAQLYGRVPQADKIAPSAIREYLNHLQTDRGYKSATLSRTIASIRIFFEFCVMREEIESSPAAHLHNPKQAKKLPVYLVKGELARLLESPDRADRLGVRDYAMLATLAFTGTRLSEIVGLNVTDLGLEQRTIRVMGKGSKERILPLNDLVYGALNEWLGVRGAPDSPAIFLNRRGGRLTGRAVEYMVRKHALRAGVFKDRLSPHKLRHTFATLLGHASVTSTQIYTHTSSSRLRAAVKKLDASAG